MTVKSADFATLAPRLSHLEDLADWLKEKIQGEDDGGEDGGGEGSLSDDDKRLWRATLLYAQDTPSGTFIEEPWKQPTWYESESVSQHTMLFGLGGTKVAYCLQNSLYDQLFTAGDTRWSSGNPPLVNKSISSEAFGFESDGYTAALRANAWSLAQAIFREPAQIGNHPNPTIVDKIEALDAKIQALDAKIQDLRGDLESFDAYVDGQIRRLDDRISSVS